MRVSLFLLYVMVSLTWSVSSYAKPTDSSFSNVQQQEKVKIHGWVTDEEGNPIIGASVIEKGDKKNGVVTNLEGEFQLTVNSSNAQIEVSYVGCQPQTLRVETGKTMKIVLRENSELLDEVIVVAFGKQKRESFTGSAGQIKSEQISERQVSNPILALNGKIAGVQMVEGNGPNSEPSIVIRGISSINAKSTPLIILDGVPYDGYWGDINPADVENITVQKDAASNALYGARGANGVIMITTKNAQRGKTNISLDAKWGVNQDAKVLYDYIDNPGQYYEMYYKAFYNSYIASGQNAQTAHRNANNVLGTFDGLNYIVYQVPENQYLIGTNGRLNPNAKLGNVVSYKGREYTLAPDDWRKEGLRNGLRQEYNLNVNGGNDSFLFYGSLGYLSNEGVSYGSDYTRYTARMKAEYQAHSWLRLGGNISYTHNESNNMNETFDAVHNIAPIYPLYLRDGNGNIMSDSHGRMYDYGDGSVIGKNRPQYISNNPIQNDLLNTNKNNSNSFNLSGFADIMFLKDFKLTVNATISDTENRITTSLNPYYGYDKIQNGNVSAHHYRTYGFTTQQILSWGKEWDAHHLSLMAAHEYYRSNSSTTGASKNNVFAYDYNKELDGAVIKDDISGNTSLYNVEGYLLRGLYDYNDTYFANFSYRRDGSSRFHPNHRWGNFWSAGGAWILTKEKWLNNVKGLDMLKFKLSYGQQGNDRINDFQYTNTYSFASVNNTPVLVFYNKGNSQISWETNISFNTGIEFELFNHLLTGSVEYYSRKTKDMLLWYTAPAALGYSGYLDNVGDLVNRGVELDVNLNLIRSKQLNWSVNLNLTHNHNEVTYLPQDNKDAVVDGVSGYINGTEFVGEGIPLYTWYLPRYAGVAEDGQSLWYRTLEDGTLGTVNNYSTADYYLCGDPNPDFYGGFGTTLSAYGFDLNVNFLYSVGGKVLDASYLNLMRNPYSGSTGWNIHKDMLKAWSPENPDSNIPRWQYGDYQANSMSDRFLIDGSSLTFKNISIGYTLPKQLTQKLQIAKLRLYASCDNVAYWSKRKGLDPRSSFAGEIYATGYSPMRTISGGINIQF